MIPPLVLVSRLSSGRVAELNVLWLVNLYNLSCGVTQPRQVCTQLQLAEQR